MSQKRGSSMSTKQLVKATVEGRKSDFYISHQGQGKFIDGYLFGIDDFHWAVVTGLGKKYLIHKGSVSHIVLHDSPTLEYDAKAYPEIKETTVKFIEWAKREFYGEKDASEL